MKEKDWNKEIIFVGIIVVLAVTLALPCFLRRFNLCVYTQTWFEFLLLLILIITLIWAVFRLIRNLD